MKKKENNSKSSKSLKTSEPTIQYLKLSQIVTGLNPRKFFDEKELKELAENIAEFGVIQPITVRPKEKDTFQIVCGERRYRSSLIAETEIIPAIVRVLNDDEALNIAFTENLHRKDMQPIEEAEVIKYFVEAKKEDFKSLAKRLGKSEPYVRTRYALNNLIDEIKELLSKDEIQVGMALLVATFEVELQQNIYHNHLKDNCIQLWRNMSYTKFSNKIENTYSMNLLDVPFDKSECENCPFNSALAQLFGENNPKCQKAACFLNKKEEYFRNIVFKIIDANPNYPILYWNADIPEWLEVYSQSKDIDIIESYDFEYYPEMPEKPLAEEYTTDNQLDEENFSEALQEYENELSEYNKEIEEVKSDIKNGKFADCLIYDNGAIEVGYYLVEDIKEPEEQDTEEAEGTGTQPNENEESNAVQSNPTPPPTPKRTFIIEKQKIESLKKQDERNFEISIENSVRDINEMFKNKTIEDTPKTELEDNLLFSFLIYESDICKAHFFAEKQSVSLENCFETTKLITESDKTFIIREYLKKNLKSYAYGSKSFATSLFFQFAEQHFEIETKDIRKKLDEVYNKRKAKIEDEIKVLEDYIKDETNKA